MKRLKLTLLFMSIIIVTSFGQESLIYTDVIKVDSIPNADLYNRAKHWLVNTYVDSKSVIQIDSKEDGQIVAKAKMVYNPKVFSGSTQTKGFINYTIELFVKNGRYKYEIKDFFHDPDGSQFGEKSFGKITTDEICPISTSFGKSWSQKVWNDIKKQIADNIASLLISLKQDMAKPSETKKDDW